MTEITMDKLTETYTLRIPEITKIEIDKLSTPLKRKLNEEILLTMAKIIHEGKFNAQLYLRTSE